MLPNELSFGFPEQLDVEHQSAHGSFCSSLFGFLKEIRKRKNDN